jgi:hypothetical protein
VEGELRRGKIDKHEQRKDRNRAEKKEGRDNEPVALNKSLVPH